MLFFTLPVLITWPLSLPFTAVVPCWFSVWAVITGLTRFTWMNERRELSDDLQLRVRFSRCPTWIYMKVYTESIVSFMFIPWWWGTKTFSSPKTKRFQRKPATHNGVESRIEQKFKIIIILRYKVRQIRMCSVCKRLYFVFFLG